MAVRVHNYITGIISKELKELRSTKDKLIPVYPVVFYNGKQTPYPYELDVFELFDDPLNIMPEVFGKPVKLIDVTQVPDNELRKQQLLGIVSRAMKYRNVNLEQKAYLSQLICDLNSIVESRIELYQFLNPLIAYLSHLTTREEIGEAIIDNLVIPEFIRGEFMTAYEQYTSEGIDIGANNEKRAIAVNALQKGFAVELVQELTGLDVETIVQLQQDLLDK